MTLAALLLALLASIFGGGNPSAAQKDPQPVIITVGETVIGPPKN